MIDLDGNEKTKTDRIGAAPTRPDPIVNATQRYVYHNANPNILPELRDVLIATPVQPDEFPYYYNEGSDSAWGIKNTEVATPSALKFDDTPRLPITFDSTQIPPVEPPGYTTFRTELVGVLDDGTESPNPTGLGFTWRSNSRYLIDPNLVIAGGAQYLGYLFGSPDGLPPVTYGGVSDIELFVPEPSTVAIAVLTMSSLNYFVSVPGTTPYQPV